MPEASTAGRAMRVSRIIHAPRNRIYQAFLDPKAVAIWLVPETMRGYVHSFEPHVGGSFRISLSYENANDAQYGKTDAATDTYHGRFLQLIPDEQIVELIEFESDDPRFAGEMRMTVTLSEVEGGTELSLLYENVPTGIRLEDNAEGTRQSLQKLAALVE